MSPMLNGPWEELSINIFGPLSTHISIGVNRRLLTTYDRRSQLISGRQNSHPNPGRDPCLIWYACEDKK